MSQRQAKRIRPGGQRSSPRSVRAEHGVVAPEGAYASPEMAHTLTTLLGCLVDVQTLPGPVYEGILKAVSPDLDIILELAHDKASGPPTKDSVIRCLEVKLVDLVQVTAKAAANPSMGRDIFRTDTEITRSNGPAGSRDLKPFEFGDGDAVLIMDDEKQTGWSIDDMWRTNQEKFSVQSAFTEETMQKVYSTELRHVDSEDYRQRAERATRLAQEIESKAMVRQGIDDSGTEEEMFSSVVRSTQPPPTALPEPQPTTPQQGSCLATDRDHEEAWPDPHALMPEGGEPTGPRLDGTGLVEAGEGGVVSSTVEGSRTAQVEEVAVSSAAAESGGQGEVACRDADTVEYVAQTLEAVALTTAVGSVEGGGEREEGEGGEGEEGGGTEAETKVKSDAVRKFKLDPNAKEFNPSFASISIPPAVTVATTRASPSSSVSSSTSSSLRSSPATSHPSTTPHAGGGSGSRKRYTPQHNPRQQRTHTPTHMPTDNPILLPSAQGSAGYAFASSQSPIAVSSGMIRPMHMHGGQVMYTAGPSYGTVQHGGGFVPGIMATTAQMGGAKVEVPTALPQVIGQPHLPSGVQPHLLASQPHFLTSVGGGGGQAPILSPAQQQQMVYLQTSAATGIPLQPGMALHQHGYLPGHPVFSQNRALYSPHHHHGGK